ncbi:MAG: hypothetical protein U5K72_10590 [Balneolaceae bacterium]|nr:hypothetical protein [Balneolaceae bacterium]
MVNQFSRFPNGFPLLLAGLKTLLPDLWIPTSAILTNIFASTAVVGLCMGISKRITKNSLAVIFVGLIVAFYPNQLNYVRQILTEPVTTFFLVLHAYLLFNNKYFSSAIFLVIAALFRSTLLPLIPIMLIILFITERTWNPKSPAFKFFGGTASIGLIYLLLVLFDVVKPSNNLGANLLISISSYGGNVDYTLSGFTSEEMKEPIKTYLSFAIDHPVEYLKQRLLSLNELWGWPSMGEPPRGIARKLLIAIRIPFLIGSVTALYLNFKKTEIWMLFSPILVITVIHVLFFSTTRFTHVVEPFAVVLTMISLNSIYNRWFKKY